MYDLREREEHSERVLIYIFAFLLAALIAVTLAVCVF
jgi:hypothetical protein